MRTITFIAWAFLINLAGITAESSSVLGDDPAIEQDCIISNIEFENSTVGTLMTRGFPLFTSFGLDKGKISDAYFDLEPMYEIDMTSWKEYAMGNNSSQVWTKMERESFGGSGGNRIDGDFLYDIGYRGMMNMRQPTLVELAFENLYGPKLECSLNSYCREAGEFAKSVGMEPPEVQQNQLFYSGPLSMSTPFTTDFWYHYEDGIKFTEAYLEALEALPEVYDQESYLVFGQRFGWANAIAFIQFTQTDVSVAGEEYIIMGSKKYEGQDCVNPEPGGVSYQNGGVPSQYLETLTPIQRARFDTLDEIDILMDMISHNTFSPTSFPTFSPSMSASPTASPSLAPTASPSVSTPTSGSQAQKQSALLVAALALFCNLIL